MAQNFVSLYTSSIILVAGLSFSLKVGLIYYALSLRSSRVLLWLCPAFVASSLECIPWELTIGVARRRRSGFLPVKMHWWKMCTRLILASAENKVGGGWLPAGFIFADCQPWGACWRGGARRKICIFSGALTV